MKTQLYLFYNSGMTNHFKNQFLLQRLRIEHLKIEKSDQALKGHTASYTIEIQDNFVPMNHFTKTEEVVESHLKDLLKTMKGFKFIITLEVTFEKNTFDSKTGKREFIHKTAYFNSKAKTITNAN